jgi:hypothetical protein
MRQPLSIGAVSMCGARARGIGPKIVLAQVQIRAHQHCPTLAESSMVSLLIWIRDVVLAMALGWIGVTVTESPRGGTVRDETVHGEQSSQPCLVKGVDGASMCVGSGIRLSVDQSCAPDAP